MTLLEEPRFPKSLYLIHPLFSGYELNPVGINAQASVAVPEGLDLDSWIVPPPLEAVPYNVDDEKGGSGKKVRSKKGKGKDAVPATTNKKNKGKENGYHTTPIPVDSEETPEERVRREKVWILFFIHKLFNFVFRRSGRQNGWPSFVMIHIILSTIGRKGSKKTLTQFPWCI